MSEATRFPRFELRLPNDSTEGVELWLCKSETEATLLTAGLPNGTLDWCPGPVRLTLEPAYCEHGCQYAHPVFRLAYVETTEEQPHA